MSGREAPMEALKGYLPPGTFDEVMRYLQQYGVHLTVARARASVLGDYRHRTRDGAHRISVNGNLNAYAFLITLLHELAHLLTFERWGHRVASHGKEWQGVFGGLLAQFLMKGVFPEDIRQSLERSLHRPAASSCADADLLRTLKKYDPQKPGFFLVEALPEGAAFRTPDGRTFVKGEKLRKRFRCTEPATGKVYLFSPVYEVEAVSPAGGRRQE